MSTWTDDQGMWNVRGRFDPVTALSVSGALDRAVEALSGQAVPESCPSDPIEKQKHLRALAFARLASCGVGDAGEHGAASVRRGRAEFVAVIDVDAPPETGAAAVEWPIPIEVPGRVLASLVADADVRTVVVRNGVVLHAPGNLNLGPNRTLTVTLPDGSVRNAGPPARRAASGCGGS